MPSDVKIKIDDMPRLRKKLDDLCSKANQAALAKWSLVLAKHILDLSQYDYLKDEIILSGFAVNEAWQNGSASVNDVRKAAFKVHELAKKSEDKLTKAALRVAGHAVATVHMKEHAIVASDYAIKAINLKYPENKFEVKQERKWQINTLRVLIK
ncbi:MAG: hypothetical protein GYA50_02890 [Eubacteriaceae bacterium]|nr:hypothetical protein [Eubacteriaceae bacterium]